MPPKPKGLKASKRAAPVDPATLANDTSASSSVALNKDQTAPLDEDALTLADLFELRTSVLEILYPFPTSLTLDDADPDRLDEARSFLRGILHGCDVLEPFVKTFEEEKAADPEREKRCAELGDDKLKALGVADRFAEMEVLYLQAFALHYLAELFEPPEQVLASAARSTASGAKRRKVDVREPQTRVEWCAAAYARVKRLTDAMRHHGEACRDNHEFDARVALGHAQYWHTVARYLDELVGPREGEPDEEVLDELRAQQGAPSMWSSARDLPGYQLGIEGHYYDADDSFFAFARAVPARIAVLERGEGGTLDELRQAVEGLEAYKRGLASDDDRGGDSALRNFVIDVLVADAKAAAFLLLEDAVEAKFRPDAEDAPEEEDEEDEEDEAEVTPLPLDAEEVIGAKKASEEAIAALRATLDSFAQLEKETAHPSAKAAQYRKLEEVLLVSSALINPDEKDKQAAVEAEIEQVRKDGSGAREGREAGEAEAK
ncbi:Proteophosphoglycan ppg4 [Rhodotorula diobovata]|uniref:Proteophosphoglycan ppg4 n=1 Tax=Rhodotorula diobovata TaxID=5288 RepID=A0A5C5FXW2_9BASI|nr:Proteophosphoglycan ppg4 [Rhodotorula diobovata]